VEKEIRNLAVATLVFAAFGVGTLVGRSPTAAAFFGIAALIGTAFCLLFLNICLLE